MTAAEKRAEFLRRRKAGIGGSDIAAIAGLCPWRSAVDVWLDKTSADIDATLPTPDGPGASLYWGTVLEREVIKAYTVATGRKTQRFNRPLVGLEPFFLGDVDALAYCDDGSRPARYSRGKATIVTDTGIEAKTARTGEGWGDRGTDSIPMHYLMQVQWYMGCCDALQQFDVTVLIGGSDWRLYRVHRDDDVISRLREIGFDFWTGYVMTEKQPLPRSYEDVRRLFPTATLRTMTASVELEKRIADYAELAAQKTDIEKRQAEIKDQIAVEMGDAEAVAAPDGRVLATFKNEKAGRVFRVKKARVAA